MPLPLLPLLFSFGASGLLVAAAKRAEAQSRRPTRVSGRRRNMSRTYLSELGLVIAKGQIPTEALLECAISEAIALGRDDVADAIITKFWPEEVDGEKTDEDAPDEDQPATVTVSGKSSPIGGVSNEAWGQFVEKLATKPADFSTDRYVGKYHLRKDRLKELGFDLIESPDEETQYAMLVADLVEARERGEDLVKQYLGTVVQVNGEEVPVTMSGIMGLLKAAGSKHAESWLANDGDRTQFPSTTNVFLATNGVF